LVALTKADFCKSAPRSNNDDDEDDNLTKALQQCEERGLRGATTAAVVVVVGDTWEVRIAEEAIPAAICDRENLGIASR